MHLALTKLNDNVEYIGTLRGPIISDVLDYVRPEEVRVISIAYENLKSSVTAQFRPAGYTVHPVDYLSATELAIVVAQAAQVHLNQMVVLGHPLFSDISIATLQYRRLHHQLYFASFECKFKKKHPPHDYTFSMSLENALKVNTTHFYNFTFVCDDYFSGSSIGAITVD